MAACLLAFSACEKDPDMDKLDSDYMVYTDYDSSTHFNEFDTYYLPDSILTPRGNGMKAEYWKDDNAKSLISEVEHNMNQLGYTRTTKKTDAGLGIQISYIQRTTQVTTSGGWYGDGWYGGGWYGSWWDPGFWGPTWGGWYYSYPVTYSYDTGTVILEMLDLNDKSKDTNDAKLPVVWHAYATGLMYGNSKLNVQLALRAIGQAFAQSAYLGK